MIESFVTGALGCKRGGDIARCRLGPRVAGCSSVTVCLCVWTGGYISWLSV